MAALPVITRELLVQARKKSLYGGRLAIALVAFIFVFSLLASELVMVAPAAQGLALFTTLSKLGFVYALLVGAFLTADCLSIEKREGTLGLLFLTDLKGSDVVLGKLCSSSLQMAYALLGLCPILAITYIFGGVTTVQLLETCLVLANTLLLSLSAGMLASTLVENDRKACFIAVFFVLIVAAGPYALGFWAANNLARGTALNFETAFLSPSPIYALTLSLEPAPQTVPRAALYTSIATTQLIAWCWLALSCLLVPRLTQEPLHKPRNRQGIPIPSAPISSRKSKSTRFRSYLLDHNPVAWLCLRSHTKQRPVWLLIGSFSAIVCWIGWKFHLALFEAVLILSFIALVLLKVWFATEICQRWALDRSNGALELLLSTPLQIRSIVRGQTRALIEQFGWPILALLVLLAIGWRALGTALIDASSKDTGRTWLLISMPVLLADLFTMRWVGLWFSLTSRSLNRAILATLFRMFFWRWLLFGIFIVAVEVARQRQMEGAWGWLKFFLYIALLLDLAFWAFTREKVLRYFRAIAANPAAWREIIQDASSQEAQPSLLRQILPQTTNWTTRFNPRRVLLRMAVCILVLLVTYRIWNEYQVESRVRKIERESKLLASGKSDSETADNRLRGTTIALQIAGIFPLLELRHQRTGQDPVSPAFLHANRSASARLREIPSLRSAILEVQGPNGWNGITACRYAADLLEGDALGKLEEGQLNDAVSLLKRMLDLATARIEPPMMVADLNGQTLARAKIVLEKLLERRGLSSAQLQAIAQKLSNIREFDEPSEITPSIQALRAGIIANYRAGLTPFLRVSGSRTAPPPGERLLITSRYGIGELIGARQRALLGQLQTLETMMVITTNFTWPKALRMADELAAKKPIRTAPNGYPIYELEHSFQKMLFFRAMSASNLRLSQTAVAFERYRLDHGYLLPNAMVYQLVSKYLPTLPMDPFAGTALRLHRTGPDGYFVCVAPSPTARALAKDWPGTPFVLTVKEPASSQPLR